MSRIVYQDVDTTEFGLDFGERGLQSGTIGDVNTHGNRRDTDCFQFGKYPLVLLSVSSKDRDGGSGFGQSESNAAAYSAVASGYYSHATAQVKHGRRLHKALPFKEPNTGLMQWNCALQMVRVNPPSGVNVVPVM